MLVVSWFANWAQVFSYLTGRRALELRLEDARIQVRRLEYERRSVSTRLEDLERRVNRHAEAHVDDAFRLLQPRPSGHVFERIGSPRDGGYVVASDLGVPNVVMSIGVGDDSTADDELAGRGARVWQFDHTIANTTARHKRIRFIRLGVGVPVNSRPTRPAEDLLKLMDIEPNDALWLLLDAEGAEWDVLTDSPEVLARFEQIVIEFHLLGRLLEPRAATVMLSALEQLNATHVSVAWHANNYAISQVIGGRHVPDVLEVTFIARPLFRPGDMFAPSNLFAANNKYGPEMPDPFSRPTGVAYGAEARCLA